MIDIKVLRAAGLTDAQILRVVEEDNKAQLEIIAEKREYERIRKRNQRARAQSPRDARDAGDNVVPLSKKEDSKERKKRERHGSRLKADWTLSDEGRAYATKQGLTDQERDREAGKFRDYWLAKAGASAVKIDWEATWRTWVTNGLEYKGRTPVLTPQKGMTVEEYHAHIQKLRDQDDGKAGEQHPRTVERSRNQSLDNGQELFPKGAVFPQTD